MKVVKFSVKFSRYKRFLLELTSGFQCSATFSTTENRGKNQQYKWSHLAGTYCVLTSLLTLGDDLENVNKEAISKSRFLFCCWAIKDIGF